jgi:hypothetical protein
MAWTDLDFPFGSVLSSSKMTQLDDNFEALANGDSGAPSIQTAALANKIVTAAKIADNTITQLNMGGDSVGSSQIIDGSVGGSEIGASAVGQSEISGNAVGVGELKIGTSTHSRSNDSSGQHTLSGGPYAFHGGERYDDNAGSGNYEDWSGQVHRGYSPDEVSWYNATNDTGEVHVVWISNGRGGYSDGTTYYYEYYVQSSPPYDLGDGEVPLFLFVEVDKQTGEVVSVVESDDPPWMHNGPTHAIGPVWDEDLELWRPRTPDEKNADMDLVPHPFLGSYREDGSLIDTVPLIVEPTGDFIEHLRRRKDETGDDLAEMVNKGYILFDNSGPTRHHAPRTTLPVKARMRNTKHDGAPLFTLSKDRQRQPVVPQTEERPAMPQVQEPTPTKVRD